MNIDDLAKTIKRIDYNTSQNYCKLKEYSLMHPLTGYIELDKDYKDYNSGFQFNIEYIYELNKDDKELELGSYVGDINNPCRVVGFKFKESLRDFYPISNTSRFCTIEAIGEVAFMLNSTNTTTNKIKIIREINFEKEYETEEEKRALLMYNVHFLKFFKNPSYELQKFVVLSSRFGIGQIKNPSKELINLFEKTYYSNYFSN